MHSTFIVSDLANDYAARFSSLENDVLKRVSDETIASHPHAHMLSGHVQGQFLSFISNILKPKYVLEIGTFTGYSAICLANGLSSDGELHTIEIREADINTARENFRLAGLEKHIFLHGGNALDIIPTLTHQWDLVFIDADKEGYIDYYELIVPRLSANGIIIADNVLFHGQVLEKEIKGKNAKAIHAFNKHVLADNRVEKVLLTLRDGLLLIKKK
jgi:predicted O-methyltransferase YrrM